MSTNPVKPPRVSAKPDPESSKWFCTCGFQNYSNLYGDLCHTCKNPKPAHQPGLNFNLKTGHLASWQCRCCFVTNRVADWSLTESCTCFRCGTIDNYARVKVHES